MWHPSSSWRPAVAPGPGACVSRSSGPRRARPSVQCLTRFRRSVTCAVLEPLRGRSGLAGSDRSRGTRAALGGPQLRAALGACVSRSSGPRRARRSAQCPTRSRVVRHLRGPGAPPRGRPGVAGSGRPRGVRPALSARRPARHSGMCLAVVRPRSARPALGGTQNRVARVGASWPSRPRRPTPRAAPGSPFRSCLEPRSGARRCGLAASVRTGLPGSVGAIRVHGHPRFRRDRPTAGISFCRELTGAGHPACRPWSCRPASAAGAPVPGRRPPEPRPMSPDPAASPSCPCVLRPAQGAGPGPPSCASSAPRRRSSPRAPRGGPLSSHPPARSAPPGCRPSRGAVPAGPIPTPLPPGSPLTAPRPLRHRRYCAIRVGARVSGVGLRWGRSRPVAEGEWSRGGGAIGKCCGRTACGHVPYVSHQTGCGAAW